MTDAETLAAVRAHVAGRLDALATRPGTWGDPAATELQYLAALETLYVLARPGDVRPRVVLDSYLAWRAGVGLAGPLMLADDLARRGRADELLPLLARFRAHVEARLAACASDPPQTPAIVRKTCAACGSASDAGRHDYTSEYGYGCPAATPPKDPR